MILSNGVTLTFFRPSGVKDSNKVELLAKQRASRIIEERFSRHIVIEAHSIKAMGKNRKVHLNNSTIFLQYHNVKSNKLNIQELKCQIPDS